MSTTVHQWNSIRSFKKRKKSGTETNNNLHFHFKYSTRCQLQITFKTLSQFSVVNKTITKILTKSHKTQLWCNHTPYIAQSLTFLCFMRSLPGGRSGILLLLFFWHRSQVVPHLWAFRRTLRLPSGSAQPWRHKVSVRRCRPESGSVLAGQTGRQCCAALDPRRKPGSEGVPQPVKVRSWSRWLPGRGRGGCSPGR